MQRKAQVGKLPSLGSDAAPNWFCNKPLGHDSQTTRPCQAGTSCPKLVPGSYSTKKPTLDLARAPFAWQSTRRLQTSHKLGRRGKGFFLMHSVPLWVHNISLQIMFVCNGEGGKKSYRRGARQEMDMSAENRGSVSKKYIISNNKNNSLPIRSIFPPERTQSALQNRCRGCFAGPCKQPPLQQDGAACCNAVELRSAGSEGDIKSS